MALIIRYCNFFLQLHWLEQHQGQPKSLIWVIYAYWSILLGHRRNYVRWKVEMFLQFGGNLSPARVLHPKIFFTHSLKLILILARFKFLARLTLFTKLSLRSLNQSITLLEYIFWPHLAQAYRQWGPLVSLHSLSVWSSRFSALGNRFSSNW